MTTADAPSSGSFIVRILFTAVVFAAIHVAILTGAISLAIFVLFCALALAPGTAALRGAGGNRPKFVLCAVALLALAACALLWPTSDGRLPLVLPPVLGYIVTSVFFAHSLLPGQVPIIVRMCLITRGDPLPEGLESYARNLTWGWAILPALLTLIALVVLAAFGLREWSWTSNVANPILLAAFFLGEHVYRAWRFPQLGKPSIVRTIEVMLNVSSWRRPS